MPQCPRPSAHPPSCRKRDRLPCCSPSQLPALNPSCPARGRRGRGAEPLRRDAERSVELARQVLIRDQRGELYDCVVAEMVLQLRNQYGIAVPIAVRHRLGVMQRRFVTFVEQGRLGKLWQCGELCLADAAFEASGRIEVNACLLYTSPS